MTHGICMVRVVACIAQAQQDASREWQVMSSMHRGKRPGHTNRSNMSPASKAVMCSQRYSLAAAKAHLCTPSGAARREPKYGKCHWSPPASQDEAEAYKYEPMHARLSALHFRDSH